MKKIFNEKNIILNASFTDKKEAIKAAGQILVDHGYVNTAYIDDMLKREEVTSTYIGNHVSIPHGVEDSQNKIIQSGISFIQVPKGVSFGEGKKAYVIIGIAGKGDEHLDILSNIALVCAEGENIEKMRRASSKEDIMNLLEAIE
ncbi:PTS sugar transporter subunit IIA [Oceanobacillus timonensis]|uniref:PTS sugar transporter subunit IIA n=1 Tax=Oceanobacillus timonensis TaxID=1926285 RepID=UPI0009BA7329|nr:PTS sugar transporter subunit IIA [Oceanobacillus timonensis]